MACILKMPSIAGKGVVSFTNIEYFRQIKKIRKNQQSIEELRKKWVICYHPNWEDKSFSDADFFDAIICNSESFAFSPEIRNLRTDQKILGVASNRMTPPFFKRGKEKIWDFCHVSRFEKRKNIFGFFDVVKAAFELRQELTGVLLVSVSPKDLSKLRERYDSVFSEREKSQFELISLSYDLPFPLSKKTLATFYNHSKVSLNTHIDEPHGRVVGYSLACGMPVVGFPDLMEMVPMKFRCEPFFYTSQEAGYLCSKLISAINYVDSSYRPDIHSDVAEMFSGAVQSELLKNKLIKQFKLDGTGWMLNDLDFRLSQHYGGLENKNSSKLSIRDFLWILSKCGNEDIVNNILNLSEIAKPMHKSIWEALQDSWHSHFKYSLKSFLRTN
ncbi:MAG: glycosyltransferase [Pseudohongiellaceae bacterium]|nr:glycosyltransferase [Pseudohongiellaceae bacterium]